MAMEMKELELVKMMKMMKELFDRDDDWEKEFNYLKGAVASKSESLEDSDSTRESTSNLGLPR
jgi:hypothetical protein